MRVSAIIVAAGSGTRLAASAPKAFVKLAEKTFLHRTLGILAEVRSIGEVVVTTPAGMEERGRAEVEAARVRFPVKVLAGGAERQDSVRLALELTSADAHLIAIHDAARPFTPIALFERCIEMAAQTGAAIAAIPLADTLKRVDREIIRETIPRTGLWQAQTPQVFRRESLIQAHREALRLGTIATDDADLVERIGIPVAIVAGSPLNLKVTTPEDLLLAEAIARGTLALQR
jgi:2-C-methyl-D-erythritol 4-phosphate cytidylyltransferase